MQRKQNKRNSSLGLCKAFLREVFQVSLEKLNLIYTCSKGIGKYEETRRVLEHGFYQFEKLHYTCAVTRKEAAGLWTTDYGKGSPNHASKNLEI